MIPVRDNIHSRSFPLATLLFILVNSYFFYYEQELTNTALNRFMNVLGFVPASFLSHVIKHPLDISNYIPLISNLFLHGGWLHIIGNMWYLWFFGGPVEDYFGSFTFLYFYFVCGIIANITQLIVDPTSAIPTIGASGAISGVLGAYLVLYPRAKISLLIPLLILFPIVQVRAWLFLIFWFLLQLHSGTMSLHTDGATIAWWAHIGGFIAGMIGAKRLRP